MSVMELQEVVSTMGDQSLLLDCMSISFGRYILQLNNRIQGLDPFPLTGQRHQSHSRI
jgi:hypothetical protein